VSKFQLGELKSQLSPYIAAVQDSENSASAAKILSQFAAAKLTFPKKILVDRPELSIGRKALKSQYSDIKLKIKKTNEVITAHRVVLAASSPYFRFVFELFHILYLIWIVSAEDCLSRE